MCFCRLFFQLLVYATGIPIDQQPHYIIFFSIVESSSSLSAPPVPVRSRRRRRRRRREGRRRRDREPLRPRRGEQEQEEGGRVKQEEVHAQDSLYDKVRMGVAHSKQGALGNSLLFNQMKNIFFKNRLIPGPPSSSPLPPPRPRRRRGGTSGRRRQRPQRGTMTQNDPIFHCIEYDGGVFQPSHIQAPSREAPFRPSGALLQGEPRDGYQEGAGHGKVYISLFLLNYTFP